MKNHMNGTDELGAVVASPSTIKDELETVESATRQLDAEMRAQPIPPDFLRAWEAFISEWRLFFASHQRWSERLFDSTYFKALEFRRRLADWREAFARAGGRPLAPGLPVIPAGGQPWERLIAVVGATAAAFAFMQIVSDVFNRRDPR